MVALGRNAFGSYSQLTERYPDKKLHTDKKSTCIRIRRGSYPPKFLSVHGYHCC